MRLFEDSLSPFFLSHLLSRHNIIYPLTLSHSISLVGRTKLRELFEIPDSVANNLSNFSADTVGNDKFRSLSQTFNEELR